MSIVEKRKFSKEQKLHILKEASEQGVTITLEKYGIYPATFYLWKKKFETMGEAGFLHGMTHAHLKEIKNHKKEDPLLKKLKAEKECLQKYLDIAQVIILGLDKSGNIQIINKKGAEILGYTQDELQGKNWYQNFTKKEKQNTQKITHYQQLVSGKVKLLEYSESVIVTKTGEERLIGWHNGLIKNAGDKIDGVLSSGVDITDSQKAHQELKAQREQLELIINKTPALIAYSDAELNYLYVNKAYASFYNSTQEEIQGKRVKDVISDNYFKQIEPHILKVLSGKEVRYKNRRINKLGEIIFVDVAYVPHYDENNCVDAFLSMIKDITEDRKKEFALRESEEKYRILFEKSNDPILLMDENGRFFDYNDAAVRALAFSDRNFLFGLTLKDISPDFQDDDLASGVMFSRLINLTQKRGSYQTNWLYINKKGLKQYFSISSTFIPYHGKYIIHLLLRDITKIKKVEKELSKLNTAIKQSSSSIVITDVQGNIEYVNPYFCNLTGYSVKEVSGQNPRILKSGKTSPETYTQMWKTITAGKTWHGELINRKKNGTLYIEAAVIAPVKNEKGEIINYIGIKQDITEWKKQEQKLIESENRYKTLFHESQAVIILIDSKTGKITSANSTATEFYGFSDDELLQKNIKEICVNVEETFENVVKKIKNYNQKYFTQQQRNAHGQIIDVELYTSIINIDGKNYIYAIIHDISDKLKAMEKLKEALMRAEQGDRIKEAFLHNLSHEFRTPMNAIIGFAELLKEGYNLNDEALEYLNIISSSTYHLLEIIQNVVDLSRIEAGELIFQYENVNVNYLLNSISDHFKQDALMKNIAFVCQKDLPDDRAIIITDYKRFRQVIDNLINNAFKFTSKGSIVFGYEFKEKEKQLAFYVKDTGIGIPIDQQADIFKHFRQVELTQTRHYGGTGVGLTISKLIIEKLGGEIHLYSVPGKGSNFYFSIPYIDNSKLEKEKISTKKSLDKVVNRLDFSLFSGKTILLVEDNQDIVFYFNALFKNSGIELLYAHTAKKTFEFLTKHTINLILMDIRMEDIDGLYLTKKVKTKYPAIPIIIQTAFARSEDKKAALEAGAIGFISKPIDKSELYNMMKNILRK